MNESTVKRWADSGRLTCLKTPGGHRKFRVRDVLGFLEEYGLDAASLGGDRDEVDGGLTPLILGRDWPALAEAFVQGALNGGPRTVSTLLLHLLTAGVSLTEMCDKVVAAGLHLVGDRWGSGEISILEEHIISSATVQGLNRLSEATPRREPTGRTALCCPGEEDLHDIGVRMTSLLLDSLGWDVLAATSATPAVEVVRHLQERKPDLLCISVVYLASEPAFAAAHGRIWEASRKSGTRVAIGGRGLRGVRNLPHDFHGESLGDLEDYVRPATGRHSGKEGTTRARSA